MTDPFDRITEWGRIRSRLDDLDRRIAEHQGATRILEFERQRAQAQLDRLRALNRRPESPPTRRVCGIVQE